MIVAKFGGTVLNGAEGLRASCAEILSFSEPVLVVVSAFSRTTSQLEHIARVATEDGAEAARLWKELYEFHDAIARASIHTNGRDRWVELAQPIKKRVAEILAGLAILRELSPRTTDLIVHFGERLASALVSSMLQELGGDEKYIPATDLIITDATFRRARPILELTEERVRSQAAFALEQHSVVVTEGYIARSVTGQVTTMGRESSDYSATLLGALLNAREVRIYTDVPGILSSDPMIVKGIATIPDLSYSMARALAELGAKILHPRTVRPVEEAGIPLIVRALSGEGSRIGTEGEGGYSVAVVPEVTIVKSAAALSGSSTARFQEKIAASATAYWQYSARSNWYVVIAGELEPELEAALNAADTPFEILSGGLVSYVSECPISVGNAARFLDTLGSELPLALNFAPGARSASAVVSRPALRSIAQKLHDQFARTNAGA